MVGLNDRIKLRPLVAAEAGARRYLASEECAIRAVCPVTDRVWAPGGGEPAVFDMVAS
jgi:glutamate synthase domain-containing protein 1